jgi:hypothetical protein
VRQALRDLQQQVSSRWICSRGSSTPSCAVRRRCGRRSRSRDSQTPGPSLWRPSRCPFQVRRGLALLVRASTRCMRGLRPIAGQPLEPVGKSYIARLSFVLARPECGPKSLALPPL